MFPCEKLGVWQRAIDFADQVYRSTWRFPEGERLGLTAQMRRAAGSISSNIAEGSARHSPDDFTRLLEIAAGSLFEVVSEAVIGRRQGCLKDDDYQQLHSGAGEQSRMLSGLRRSPGVG